MNVIKESLKYTKKYMPAWIGVVLMGVLSIVSLALLPQLPALIIDSVINPLLNPNIPPVDTNNFFSFAIADINQSDFTGILTRLLIIMGSLLLTRYIIHYLRWHLSHYCGVVTEKEMRLATFSKMLDQNSIIMSRYTSGDLMSICNSDPNQVKDFWALNFSIMVDHFLIIVVATYFLATINIYLLFVPLGLGLVASFFMYRFIKALRRCYNDIRTASINLNSCVQENINGVRIIRSYASENVEDKKFSQKNKAYRDNFISQTKVVAKYSTIFNTIGHTINIASIVIGVLLAYKGIISPGQFTVFTTYITYINNALIQFTNQMGVIQQQMISGNRMFTFLNIRNTICDPAEPLEINEKPNLAMHNVSIKLDDNEELKNVSVEIPYGKKLGIMGKTGAGKSVMIKALTRLFETTYGETVLNGNNIKRYRVDDVRRQFSYVMQDVFLFSNTVDANVAFYNPDASHDEVVRVCKIADADGFASKLVDGYDTVVGEKGLGLSGGQKQRLSIARALLKDAPVILLDDCTSALDMETERKILGNIYSEYSDRTLIIASHRASSVMDCDEILYLENGEVTERGTHTELVNLKGRYYEVYNSQMTQAKGAIG